MNGEKFIHTKTSSLDGDMVVVGIAIATAVAFVAWGVLYFI